MPTQNRRVATYLPPHIDTPFKDFKSKREIKGDSEALIAILSEYFQVSQEVAYPNSSNLLQRIEGLEDRLSSLKSELLSELKSELKSQLPIMQPNIDGFISDEALTTKQLAERLKVDGTTLSHRKKRQSPDEFADWSKTKDPETKSWVWVQALQKYCPKIDLPSELQGTLLTT
jgi:hypothetical protein